MQRNKKVIPKKIMAALLAFAMIVYLMPAPLAEKAAASTQNHSDALTVTVVNAQGNPVSGAEVKGTLKRFNETGLSSDASVDATTDTNGEAVIAEAADISGYVPQIGKKCARLDGFSVSCSGYLTDDSIDKIIVTSTGQNLKVTLKSSTINANVTAANVTYDGTAHPAATVSGTEPGDTIEYNLNNGGWQDKMPSITEPGNYTLWVKITRAGCTGVEKDVAPAVNPAVFTPTVTEYNGNYDGNDHPALSVSGLLPSDTVTYQLNGGNEQSTIPNVKDVGTYSVTMHVARHGYQAYANTFTKVMVSATTIDGLSASAYSGTYDGTEHPAVTVGGTKEGDTVQYQLNNGDWTSVVPQIKNAGTYPVKVKVSRTNYKDTDVEVIPANAVIQKANQTLKFDSSDYTDGGQKIVMLDPDDLTKNVYSFSAQGGNETGNSITYKVENASGDSPEIAQIGSTGKLTVKAVGCVKITAMCSGNNNYSDTVITYIVAVQAPSGNLIKFPVASESYVLGQNSGVAAHETATKTNSGDNGTVTYSIDQTNIGLAIDSSTGKLTVSDYEKLGDALTGGGGSVQVTVTANKKAGTMPRFSPSPAYDAYPVAVASYTVTVSFLTAPTDAYEIAGTQGNNGWYTSAVSVTPKDQSAYTISNTCVPATFSPSVTFSDQGAGLRMVHLRETATGGITPGIPLKNLKIDTGKPDANQMNITYSTSIMDAVLSAITFGFYKPSVTVTFTAADTVSGINHFDWTYTKQAGASTGDLPSQTGSLPAAGKPGSASAQLTLTATEAQQYRGNLSFTATNSAGITSNSKTDSNHVIVIDTTSPTRSVTFSSPKKSVGKHMYFDSDATITFSVCEANFFADDVSVQVSKNGGASYAVSPTWTDGETDTHTGTLTLKAPADHTGDGDYIVTMKYKDRSGNEMDPYTSDPITLDTTPPVIGFTYNAVNQTAEVQVTEHNFEPSDISAVVSSKDIDGKDVAPHDITAYLRNCSWAQQGDVHTATISDWTDAVYDLKLDYQDLACLQAKQADTGVFTVDHTPPDISTMKVTYSKSILDSVLSTLTFGFYHSPMQVTFTARDAVSGVDHFDWSYARQTGASTINRESDKGTLQAVTQEGVASATVTLPDKEQLRGSITFTATDKCGNESGKRTDDGHILVVDTIRPDMTVTYSPANRTVGSRMYYSAAATATLTVHEANFFAQDVTVMASKNGGTPYAVTPSWTDKDADTHVGELTFAAPADHSGDGDYVVTVSYTDRSGNEMAAYTSQMLTIDTKAPVIDVSYSNPEVKNTVTDGSGNTRKYYGSTQTAKVTVTEHNFDKNSTGLSIMAKDVSGQALNSNGLLSESAWSDSGDQHTIAVTFSGEANYQFSVSCTDLAGNTENHRPDSFTVDRTAPDSLKVSYSQSVLDTVLESISFGFYRARMTVTLSAADRMAGISEFQYSYARAAGASSVNGQQLDQTVPAADIAYSSDGRYGTAQFQIPKMEPGSGSQFNGSVKFSAKDRSGNSTEYQDTKRIVVDNIAPSATVAYNAPVRKQNNISYYSGSVSATVTVTEANFFSQDVSVSVSRGGGNASVISPRWTDASADTHTGTFTLSGDGDYKVFITYRDRSGNQMTSYTSNQLTVDTKIDAPVITINGSDGNGKAFQGDVVPAVSFSDQNYDGYDLTMTRTSCEKKNENVTSKYVGSNMSITDRGGSGSFHTFDKTAGNDGIYTLTAKVMDKAGHSSTSSCMFTVNRFGSVYSYNDALSRLIAGGGAYVKSVGDDLIITEYNATKLLQNSLNIDITRDGNPLSSPSYTVSPEINTTAAPGANGWYQYQYVIRKGNFKSDGVYKVVVSSKDAAGNTPENTNYKDKTILFRVDSTPPELTSVTGLDSGIINAQKVKVQYVAYDTIGLKSTDVYLDGKKINEVTDFKGNRNNYKGGFELGENSNAQKVRIVLRDLAGNVTDTDSASFKSVYAFDKNVIVSTNAFVRWYADKPLFWGSIGGCAVVIAGAAALIIRVKRKRAVKQ